MSLFSFREVNFDLGDDKSEKSEFFEKNAPQRGSPLKWIEEKVRNEIRMNEKNTIW